VYCFFFFLIFILSFVLFYVSYQFFLFK